MTIKRIIKKEEETYLYNSTRHSKNPTNHMAGSTTSQVEERTTPKGLEVHLPLKMKLALVTQEVTADEMH